MISFFNVFFFFDRFRFSFFFYLYYIFYNRALQLAQVNKIVVIIYLQIVFVFILGNIFLGEKIYETDIIGTLLMASYMIYNVLNPIKIHSSKDYSGENITRRLSHFSMAEFSYTDEEAKKN